MKNFGKLLDSMLKEAGADKRTSGQTVRLHRKRFEMTLKELEEVTGLRESNLSAIENDKIEMTPHYAEIFAAAFGVSPSSLLYPNGQSEKTKELAEVERRMNKYVRRTFGLASKRKKVAV